ncbi:hypothetical protein [Clostridium botulinum]|uniref:Uncharacterized protein n=1 Tax=Clostridium botulinum (strain Langeland / NCTC 10281 / Type F) TaxID=441772 RepID=A7GFI1_CLOBL|nr:hypothetical protein [Clostridium botulinum]ABS39867.1 hypothetical protein CLI_2291 [Clostridium botulinum F str. Langeland]ADF99944.1 hypothetical protein CBF_2280 [Clostridium botulinum F str. 230613]KKM42487.1 hypothetical protein VT72_02280 [Clostridium botulinum]NEZ52475.1 hypothetical protein [Clostridium botulinum F str. Langeland]NFF56240.1 hypothetical protein [Clostridium botulinum]
MNRNKKNKNVKVNKAIENSGNSNSIDALNVADSSNNKNIKDKNK